MPCDSIHDFGLAVCVCIRAIWLIVGLLNLATVILTILLLKWMTRRFVEDAIGDQMIVQARIAAHLVAIANDKGMTPAEINPHFQEIASFLRTARFRLRFCDYRRPGQSAVAGTR